MSNGQIEYKISFDDEFRLLPQRFKPVPRNVDHLRLHKQALKVKTSKIQHLQELKVVIPMIYHAFYDSLPH